MRQIVNEIGVKLFLKSRSTGLFIGTIIGLMWFLYGVRFISFPYSIVFLTPGIGIAIFFLRNAVRIKQKGRQAPVSTPIEKKRIQN